MKTGKDAPKGLEGLILRPSPGMRFGTKSINEIKYETVFRSIVKTNRYIFFFKTRRTNRNFIMYLSTFFSIILINFQTLRKKKLIFYNFYSQNKNYYCFTMKYNFSLVIDSKLMYLCDFYFKNNTVIYSSNI